MSKLMVFTYGVFDLLHPGHISLLERSKELGDHLTVGIVPDHAVRDKKGPDRPIFNEKDRLRIVRSLKCVDDAMIMDSYNPINTMEILPRVDILTKGDDWEVIPGSEYGCKVIKLPYSHEYSTTRLVNKIRGRE